MPIPALNSIAGDPNANTFADLDFYKTYIATRRPQPSFTAQAEAGLIDTDLTIDLLASCEVLNAGMTWANPPATDTQALIMPGLNWRDRFGRLIPNDTVHDAMKRAQCELAVQLHEDALSKAEANDILSDDDAAKFNVNKVSAGPVSVQFQTAGNNLEAIYTRMRAQESQFNYLTIVPRAVRLLLVPSWFVEAEMCKGFIFEPI